MLSLCHYLTTLFTFVVTMSLFLSSIYNCHCVTISQHCLHVLSVTVIVSCRVVSLQVSGFSELVDRYQQSLGSGDYDHAAKVWTGVDMVAQLDHLGIGPNKFDQLKVCLGPSVH